MNTDSEHVEYYAFWEQVLVASGGLGQIIPILKSQLNHQYMKQVLLFHVSDGRQLEIDLDGIDKDMVLRLDGNDQVYELTETANCSRTRGRPKLGVVGREVTLLPRHWEWLESQRGGASAAMRRLVDQARKELSDQEVVRQSQDAAQRFMTAMAGNLPGYEEAVRALYARNKARFEKETAKWPTDIRRCTRTYAEYAFS